MTLLQERNLRMFKRIRWWQIGLLGLLGLVVVAGCQRARTLGSVGNQAGAGSDGAAYLLAEEPPGAKGVR